MAYQLLWTSKSGTGILPGEYATEEDAQAAGQRWVAEMSAIDGIDPQARSNPYSVELLGTRAAPIADWTFAVAVVAPPATGQLLVNNANQTLATKVWLNKIANKGTDMTAQLAAIVSGQNLYFADLADPTKWQRYSVIGAPIAASTYYEYPVVWRGGGTALTAKPVNVTVETVPVYVTGTQAAASVGSATVGFGHYVTSPGAMTAAVGSVAVQAKMAVTVPVDGQRLYVGHGYVSVVGLQIYDGYAFPFETPVGISSGLTKRQWYAGMALSGFISSGVAQNLMKGNLAAYAFKLADSLIEYEAGEAVTPELLPRQRKPRPQLVPLPLQAPATVTDEQAAALQELSKTVM